MAFSSNAAGHRGGEIVENLATRQEFRSEMKCVEDRVLVQTKKRISERR